MEAEYGKPGVKTKLAGFIIMVLGVLDCLLNLRGGLPAYEKYLFLVFIGATVFAIGAARGARAGSVQGTPAGRANENSGAP